jgi:hypothetical protein
VTSHRYHNELDYVPPLEQHLHLAGLTPVDEAQLFQYLGGDDMVLVAYVNVPEYVLHGRLVTVLGGYRPL